MVYIPTGNTRIIASLRDESPLRQASVPPAVFEGADTRYIIPLDPMGGGSWIGINDRNTAIILLNGAFEKHLPSPPYVMSRGQVVKKLLDSTFPVVEWLLMPMAGIEPYTLIVFTDGLLFRLTWDGAEKHRQPLDADICHIFSSATLYDSQARQQREHLFYNWMAMRPPVDKLSLLDFFNSVDDRANGFIINREEKVKTLSYSFINLDSIEPQFHYYDLRKYRYYSASFSADSVDIIR